jgi:UDP-4-amino-4,6-dideoxy-N-acetyl-beta-L-altrosamine transaminase
MSAQVPAQTAIAYGRQTIGQDDIDAVVAVLRSDYLTQGPTTPAFEQAVATYCGAQHAIATNSATSALHIACLALGLGAGDRAWTSAITFAASANCVLYCGAQVDFVDIDAGTYNMCPDALEGKLLQAQRIGTLPKVVIPVHMTGQPCDMQRIHALSQRFGFKIIEDASHAIGAHYLDQPVGNCRYSNITVFSFHPVKIITSGEGGMAVTNDDQLASAMCKLRSHGITSHSHEMLERPEHEIWNYQQLALGFNYRMTDIHAALGLSQLHKLDGFVTERQRLAARYDEALKNSTWTRPAQAANTTSSFHLYVVRCGENTSQKLAYSRLRSLGVLVNLHYIPVYRHPYYERMGFTKDLCPNAEQYFTSALSIPIYPGLSEAQQTTVIEAMQQIASS